MRVNLPVTRQNSDYSGDEQLVSCINIRGEITHCNPVFVRVSNYGYDELPYNIIRYTDMPADAYKDRWRTIDRGEPWTGLIKNRRKGGDPYKVRANVTPVLEGGKHSSTKIREIVGVIEGIAFQTNLLALDAAVEVLVRARWEVGALAQRSASSVKEISGLIDVTVNQIASIRGVVDAVGRVSALVQQISSATRQQSQDFARSTRPSPSSTS